MDPWFPLDGREQAAVTLAPEDKSHRRPLVRASDQHHKGNGIFLLADFKRLAAFPHDSLR
jgi:hypothetical protein